MSLIPILNSMRPLPILRRTYFLRCVEGWQEKAWNRLVMENEDGETCNGSFYDRICDYVGAVLAQDHECFFVHGNGGTMYDLAEYLETVLAANVVPCDGELLPSDQCPTQ